MSLKKIKIGRITYVIIFFILLIWAVLYVMLKRASYNPYTHIDTYQLTLDIEYGHRQKAISTFMKYPLAVNMVTEVGVTPLAFATAKGDIKMVLFLVIA